MNFAGFCGCKATRTGSNNIVVIGGSCTIEFGNIAVLKVPENFGTFAEVDCCGCGDRSTLNRRRYGTGCNSSVACGEGKSVKGSYSVIGEHERNIRSLKFNFV